MNREAFEKWMQALEAPENQYLQGFNQFSLFIEKGSGGRPVRSYSLCCAIGLAMRTLLPHKGVPMPEDVAKALGVTSYYGTPIFIETLKLNDQDKLPFVQIAKVLRANADAGKYGEFDDGSDRVSNLPCTAWSHVICRNAPCEAGL